jgi:hypothetical protein
LRRHFSDFAFACNRTKKPSDYIEGEKADFHHEDVDEILMDIVYKNYIKPLGKSNPFKNCKPDTPTDFQFKDHTLMLAFGIEMKQFYASQLLKMQRLVYRYIDIKSVKALFLAKQLIELICDSDVPADQKFDVYKKGYTITAVAKSELNTVKELYLPSFLLSVWFYVVTNCKDNTKGEATINSWFPKGKKQYNGITGEGITALEKVTADKPPESEAAKTENDTSYKEDCVRTSDEPSAQTERYEYTDDSFCGFSDGFADNAIPNDLKVLVNSGIIQQNVNSQNINNCPGSVFNFG